jgi:predicted nucleic acid-binding protein
VSLTIFLDSSPLGLLTQRRGVRAAEDCRAWLARHLAIGNRFIVPEVIDYELRRELLRAGKTFSISRLDTFVVAIPDRYLPLSTPAMRLAADLWADIRRRGLPTTDPRDLDIDVILAAQALGVGLPPADLIVATSNPAHLSRFVTAELWQNI